MTMKGSTKKTTSHKTGSSSRGTASGRTAEAAPEKASPGKRRKSARPVETGAESGSVELSVQADESKGPRSSDSNEQFVDHSYNEIPQFGDSEEEDDSRQFS